MALPGSGTLSMSQLHAEFGLGYSLGSYRGKGSMPSTGQISMSQLYGASNIIREPASGEIYQASAPIYRWYNNPNINQNGNIRSVDVLWNGTRVGGLSSANSNAAWSGTTLTVGGWTYYRGSLISGTDNNAGAVYALYRIQA